MSFSVPRRVVLLAGLAMVGWTAIVASLLLWDLALMRSQVQAFGYVQAQGAFDRDVSYRRWAANVGGVYVDATAVQPNPYLKVEHRDLETAAGPLTLVNPAYMTRMVHDYASQTTGIVSHITSLDPIRPANAPMPWEVVALRRFEGGVADYADVTATGDGHRMLRFMRPLIVERSCLPCHEIQGYEEGDVRGGISVTLPLEPVDAIMAPTRHAAMIGYGCVWLVGLMGLGTGAIVFTRMSRRLAQVRHRADEADQAKSRFLATMSHQLRTPLTSVLGFSQLMEQKLFGPLGSPNYDGYIRDIRRSGEHLLALINDVLDLSKIEAGRLTLDEHPLSLAEAVDDAVTLIRAQADKAGVRLDQDVQADMPALMADRRAVRQMLLNLLGNAVRFTPAGGRILVSATLDHRGRQMVMVSDTGVGIPEDEIERVLEPFHQAPTQRHHGERGTGLGLALVKAFIGLHGGTITVHSREDVGTSVSLRFPAERTVSPEVHNGGVQNGGAQKGGAPKGPAQNGVTQRGRWTPAPRAGEGRQTEPTDTTLRPGPDQRPKGG